VIIIPGEGANRGHGAQAGSSRPRRSGARMSLYVQVIIAMALGIAVGAIWPAFGAALKPLGDAFIRLIKLLVAPVIFCTVVSGIGRMGDMRAVGRVGGRALIYFEIVSTLALALGIVVALVVQPGRGFNIDVATLDPSIAVGHLKPAADSNRLANLWGLPEEVHQLATNEWTAFRNALRGREPSQAEVMAMKLKIDRMVAPYIRRPGLPQPGPIPK